MKLSFLVKVNPLAHSRPLSTKSIIVKTSSTSFASHLLPEGNHLSSKKTRKTARTMSSYISRLLKAPAASKRLISNLTQREGKLSSLLRQFGWLRQGGVAVTKPRAISTTQVQKSALIDDEELITGIQKREHQLAKQGCDDPWMFRKIIKRGTGRENDPTVIPSAFDARIVGCLCLDDRQPKWMWIEKDEGPKRCECGHFFVLKNVPPV